MNIHQVFLSNVPEHYVSDNGLMAMGQNIVEIPIEQHITIANSHNVQFTNNGSTSWDWLEHRGKEVVAYFDAAWPGTNGTPSLHPHEYDPQWFRREHVQEVRKKGWYIDAGHPERPRTDPRPAAYKKYLVDKILEVGVKAIMFDDMTLDSSRTSWANADWFRIFDTLREDGITVYANGVWQKDYAMDHVDGFTCELWTGNRPHYIKPNGKWGALTEAEFVDISRRWVAAGKRAVMLVRWRPGESVYSNYDDFCHHYMELADTCGATPSFARINYQVSGWREWMAEYQDAAPPLPDDDELEKRIAMLENRLVSIETWRDRMAVANA